MIFSLRYQAQLRRTRPELYSFLEKSFLETIQASRGEVGLEHRLITAAFDEKAIGFWLDILMVLRTLMKLLEDASLELYGHICLLGRDLKEGDVKLARTLSSGGTGFWCDPGVQQALSPYAVFENNYREVQGVIQGEGYNRIKNFKTPAKGEEHRSFPYRARILKILDQGTVRSAVLVGPQFIGKRDGLRRYCHNLVRGFPCLIVVFGAGGSGLACFIDAFKPEIRNFISPFAGPSRLKELDTLAEAILRERFRKQYSFYLLQRARHFMELLLDAYDKAAAARSVKPVIILENLNQADQSAFQFFSGLYQKMKKNSCLVYGTYSVSGREVNIEPWNGIFTRVIQVSLENFSAPPAPELSQDLWEIGYVLTLFRRYFPSAQFLSLFKEARVNPLMVSWALDIFAELGLIDFREDPQLRIEDFIPLGKRFLGERRFLMQAMVCERILAHVNEGKFNPCYNLLEALAELGGEGSDTLILDSIIADVVNNTYDDIERAIEKGSFKDVAGRRRAAMLLYIFTTSRALIHQDERGIREIFLKPPPEADSILLYKAQMLSNLAGHHLGVQENDAALDVVKESMLISQNEQKGRGLAQAYRLFSLVNISKQRINDAIDYAAFAIENAEHSGYTDELAVTAYYSTGIHFLFGNLSKAERLALQSDEAASAAGRLEWADRSRFFLGRLRFETGRYKEAGDIFQSLLNQEIPGASEYRDLTLAAWIFRSEIFRQGGHGISALPDLPAGSADARLFEIEGAYLAGDYRRTVILADTMYQSLPGNRFHFIEQPDWWSGFAQCEFLLFQPRDFFSRLLFTYRALALSRMGDKSESAQGESRDLMRRVIREEGLPQTDPNDAFYYYSHYRVLQETGAVEVDMNTAVSIAFKRLQSRASRIDDVGTRRAYLSLNHWNAALGEIAKVHKLI
jgi:hypothetical protein